MPRHHQPFTSLLVVLAAGSQACGLTVRAVSPRVGLLFADSEPVDVRVRVDDALLAATVAYTVEQSGGPWRAKGEVTMGDLAGGAAEKPLPLALPGRGLYRLTLTARSGGAVAVAETWVAVVFTPPRPEAASPWGIFYTPHTWFNPADANGAREAARSHRLLGASWSRLNFWAHSFGKVTVTPAREGQPAEVTAELARWKSFARALREEGISILGEIAQCPRELSSRPDDVDVLGDAGPMWGRVRPRDYALWDRLMENVAREFRDEIGVWEVWNEANLRGRYWAGTPEELIELIEHTARALRRGNPAARIAAAGFVGDIAYADRLMSLGLGRHIDILSVHYTDERPDEIDRWRALLARHKLALPIWNTEERSEVPLRNLAGPIERSFKFIHVAIGYGEYRPLIRKDLTVLPAGIAYSVGAHCIGAARFAGRSELVPGYDVLFFRRGAETIAAFDRNQKTGVPRLFGPSAGRVTLAAEAMDAAAPTVTDIWGRSRPLEIANARASVELGESMIFLNGCRRLEVVAAETPQAETRAHVFEAEDARHSEGWDANPKAGFSGGRILEIWKKPPAPPGGYWTELKLAVPAAGRYEVLFSGNSLARLAEPRSLSSFTWQIGAAPAREARGDIEVLQGIAGAPEGLSVLGTVELDKGEHTFRLVLTAPRKQPDDHYALWFDAVALRATQDHKERQETTKTTKTTKGTK